MMYVADMNILAVVVAVAANMAFGMFWYNPRFLARRG